MSIQCFRQFSAWLVLSIVLFVVTEFTFAGDENRLSRLDSNEVWFPDKDFPRLITPQWVGEDGVECVVVLAIDDMRESSKYEAYLRPILQRLKDIDGRAPVSIMTCSVKPDDPQLQSWLQEGLSLECHTFDHPCPLLAGTDIEKSKATYDKCVDLLASVPNCKPVAFRTPCCDSLNTVSPRLFSEIIGKTTSLGNYLQLDSSVFVLYTADDPEIPRDWITDADGQEKFRKYVPRRLKRGDQIHDGFVNTIENYPYPYVIQNRCWEFPCMVPSDWSANHLHEPKNPVTVRDLKLALDITVSKQGVMNLVFHPHGWISAEQVVELIDHAVTRYGKKVKFLNFKECVDRLNLNALGGQTLRNKAGDDNGVRLVDVTDDGFMDVVVMNEQINRTRIWSRKKNQWLDSVEPSRQPKQSDPTHAIPQNVFWWTNHSVIERTGMSPDSAGGLSNGLQLKTWNADQNSWVVGTDHLLDDAIHLSVSKKREKLRCAIVRDIDGDDRPEILVQSESGRSWAVVSRKSASNVSTEFVSRDWFPKTVTLCRSSGRDAGLRFVDLNDDGRLDLVISNTERCGAWLFESIEKGWSIELFDVKRVEGKLENDLPLIVRADGSDNGFFIRDRHLCWINEGTATLTDMLQRVSFTKLLGDRLPEAKSPRAAIKSMRVPPGYQIELVASEPLTMDPVAFDWGTDGKLWVAEMADYPLGSDGKGSPGGRIRFLEDSDNDGRYDTSTVLLDGVSFPSGVLAWKNGVLVSAAPEIFYAEDTNHDGKADVREVLFTGFVEGNQQHRVNGFTRGLDNWLYLANGDSGGIVTSVKTGKSLELRGRDLRIRPETGEMELIAGTSQFGRNCDDWGNWFGNNNSRPMWHFVLDDHYLRRNESFAFPSFQTDVSITPGAAAVFPTSNTLARFNDFHTANRFTSACSAIVDRDEVLFGPVGSNVQHTFVSEPVHNLVHHEVMTADGCSFSSRRGPAEEQSEFVSSTDNWFRPTMLRTGPDGALWIADMYRSVIEHPQWIPVEWQKKLDLRAGEDKGRIWRVFPIGKKRRGIPRLDRFTSKELVAALDSPNGWTRDVIQQRLIQIADPTTIPLLRAQARESKNALCRLHSLCTLDGMKDGLNSQLIFESLADSHPGVRRHAVRLLESQGAPSAAVIERLSGLVEVPDDKVRLQLAYTLGEFKHPATGRILGRVLRRSKSDPYIVAAAMSSLTRDNLSDVLKEVLDDETAPTALLEQLISQAVAFRHEPALLALVGKLTTPDANGHYSVWQFAAIDQLLTSLARRGDSFDQWVSKLDAMNKPLESRIRSLFAQAKKIVNDESAALPDRIAAVRVFGQSPEDAAVLDELISPQQPPELQAEALRAIARLQSPEIGKSLLAKFRTLGPKLRSQSCDVLLSRLSWSDDLLTALESKQLAPADLDAASRQRLLVHNSKSIRDRATKLFATDLNSDRAKLIAEYLPAVRNGGDPRQGSQLFEKRCSQCHKLGEVGHAVGPDLTSLSDKSAEVLMTAILDPNRAVEARYLTFTSITKAGIAHSGILVSESSGSITLRAAEGKDTVLLRNEIEELQSTTKSLMPEGLERDLTPADAASLITYIRRNLPLPALKAFPGNEPRVIQPDPRGALTLTPFEAEIYGPTIVIEDQHKNLGWWSSLDDYAVWTINVSKPGTYIVDWTWACDPQAAGNSITIESFGRSFTRAVEATNGWEDYRTASLGEIDLPAGEVRLVVKPASRPLPALADVKSLVLRRKK